MFLVFGIDITFINVFFGYTLIFLSYAVPHPPAQLGSNELIMILIFSAGFGYGIAEMSSVMLLSHFVTAIVIFITGSLGFVLSGIPMTEIVKKFFNRNEQKEEINE
jgi:uncharacterized membrane protein YbhN (UPF0104 family)